MFTHLITIVLASCALSAVAHAGNDLTLEVRAPNARVVEGERLGLSMALRNEGESMRWVVRPGDGSEVGWREPHVWFTVDRRRADGRWEAVWPKQFGRCGIFDVDWEKDAFELGPDATLVMGDWLLDPVHNFRLTPGRYRVTGHYAYRGGVVQHRPPMTPRRVMPGVAPFEVASAPVEVTVVAR